MVEYLLPNLKVGGSRLPCAQTLFHTPPENSGGAEKSTENSGSHAKNFFCSMYEMSQRHPVWVAENHVSPCNSEDHGINCSEKQKFLVKINLEEGLNR